MCQLLKRTCNLFLLENNTKFKSMSIKAHFLAIMVSVAVLCNCLSSNYVKFNCSQVFEDLKMRL